MPKQTNPTGYILNDEIEDTTHLNKPSKILILLTAAIALTYISYIFGYRIVPWIDKETFNQSNRKKDKRILSNSKVVDFINYNEYTKFLPLSGYYPIENIIEPHRLTHLKIINPIESYKYIWYFNDWHLDEGTEVNITLTNEYLLTSPSLKVKVFDKRTGIYLTEKNKNISVKYVRREIRSLLEQDRVAFFQAMSIIQRIPTQIGRKLYGKHYKSKDYLNRIHLYFGGRKECDHWHQGPGFVVTHFAFSYLLEKSLQSINPSLALPYWDFTLESTFYEALSFRNSLVFSDDWFSDAVASNKFHTPTKGRFSFNQVMKNAQNFSDLVNAYGLLRAQWNADPNIYMTRSNLIYDVENNLKPSGCTEYYNTLMHFDWMSLSMSLNSDAHGHIHELMGGSFGFSNVLNIPSKETNPEGNNAGYIFSHLTEADSKVLWRSDLLVCPLFDGNSNCTIENSKIDLDRNCNCYCVPEMYDDSKFISLMETSGILVGLEFYDEDGNAISKFESKKKKKTYFPIPGYSKEESYSIYRKIRDFICDFGFIGDMFQATSSNDITFWLLHPNMERLWHLVRLNEFKGIISFNHSWIDSEISCSGHYSTDNTPFENLFDNEENGIHNYNNLELYDILAPFNKNMTYVYDNFKWSHCELIGYNMTGY